MIYTNVKKLVEHAQLPRYAEDGSIGADLFSAVFKVIPAKSRVVVGTGLALSAKCMPGACGYLRIAPRSGLAAKGIDVGAGVIDLSYRGEIKVILINHNDHDYTISVADRIAQLIFETADIMRFIEVPELDETERGAGGFGSTGN